MIRTLLPFAAVAPAAIYSLLTLYCADRYFSRSPQPEPETTGHEHPDVTILKPVKGMDADSLENFESFCRQDYRGALQIIFALAAGDDPAVPVIRRVMTDHPGIDIRLVIDPTVHGPNLKVSNVINASAAAAHDILIVCDSDIRVPPGYLASVTAHFRDPRVGLVTSLYRTSRVASIGAAVEATGFTSEMIPNVLVARQLEGLTFALGASMAVRRQALEAIGGFQALAEYLADDYQLGNKIHHAGWRLVLDSCFVESMLKQERLRTALSRQLRWARTMRVSRTGGYLASGLTLPVPGALLALLAAPGLQAGIVAVVLLYGIRMLVTVVFSRRFVRDNLMPCWLWLLPFRDLLSFGTWFLSFLGDHVEWRGTRYRLLPGGTITAISSGAVRRSSAG
jgi:ceramide glucosyltransferase